MKTKISLSDHFTYNKIFRFCISPIIMMIFTSIYGVVDGLFISNFVGKTPFAAINLIMPFVMVTGGVGFMIGTGGNALVAKTLGEGDKEKANRYFTMMVKLCIYLGAFISVVGIIFMEPIALLLGATDAMLHDCVVYGNISLVFTAAFMLQSLSHTFLATAEKPHIGLLVTVIAGVGNMVLDALFIAVFHWGVAGAALATGLSQCIGGLIPLVYFIAPNSSILRLRNAKMQIRPILTACANGSSELASNISMSLVSMLYNFQLLRFGGENGVAAYGTLMYIQFAFIAIFIGYTIGTAPVISFHYGAKNHDEVKSLLKKSSILTFSCGIVMMIAAHLLAAPLAKIFVGYDAELYEMTKHAFHVYSYSFLFAGFNIFASSFFTALNNGAVSAAISFLRTLLFQTASVLILPILFGIDGIWWAITIAEIFALMISAIFIYVFRKKYSYL